MFDLSDFFLQGYQVVRGVFETERIERVREFLDQELGRNLELIRQQIPFADLAALVAEVGALSHQPDVLANMEPGFRNLLSGHFELTTRLNPILRELPQSPRLQLLLAQVFPEENLRMHMPPTARFILPGNIYAGVPPHQDISYNHHMSDFITVWCPLVPIDASCGGVAIYPGQFESEGLESHSDNAFWLPSARLSNPADYVCFDYEPGDVLLLNKFILHASLPNDSDRIRLSVDMRFFGHHSHSSKHYLDLVSQEVMAPEGISA